MMDDITTLIFDCGRYSVVAHIGQAKVALAIKWSHYERGARILIPMSKTITGYHWELRNLVVVRGAETHRRLMNNYTLSDIYDAAMDELKQLRKEIG